MAHDRNMLAGGAWATTPVEVTFNPYQPGDYTISTSRSGDYSTMYAEQKRLGRPISYQTAIAAKIGDWQQTLDWVVAQGASFVELPREYTTGNQTILPTYNAKPAGN